MKKHDPRWIALYVLCLGVLMIVLDTTIVNVALPSIKSDLHFTDSSLAWIVNAYMLTSGGFLLLGGRLGDLYGPRKLFLIGLTLFTAASAVCGLASVQWLLIVMRAIQGTGAAVVTAVALSLIMNLFPEEKDRAKAMGVYGFVCASGGSVGVLLGGILVSSLNWHWIFWVNIPIGIAVFFATRLTVPEPKERHPGHLDIFGAISITSAMLLLVYSIVNQKFILLAPTAFLLGVFVLWEARNKHPLMRLKLFKDRNLSLGSVMGALWSAGMFAQFFLASLYLQQVLFYPPLKVGLAFLAPDLIMAAFSLGLSARIVVRWGIKKPLFLGLSLATLSLLWWIHAPVNGMFYRDILGPEILLGIGAGMAFNPMLLASMKNIQPNDSGVASGLTNTAFMMGGAVGLAVLSSVAASITETMNQVSTSDQLANLNAGYHAAFLVGAIFTAIAAFLTFGMKVNSKTA